MANVVVIGSQWGDEGKGKIVDWLSERADVVVRFQGGHNAGHTLVIDGTTYKLNLLPSGVVRPKKLSIIGNGVVIDPWALLDEMETVRRLGVEVTPENVRALDWLPHTCAYRLVAFGHDLPPWHHLVCGDPARVPALCISPTATSCPAGFRPRPPNR